MPMSSSRAKMFNRKAAKKGNGEKVVKVLGLEKGWRVADIGSGGGYFSFLFAREVGPEGKVLALDVDAGMLAYVKEEAARQGLDNIDTKLISENRIDLPGIKFHLLFMRNVTHHIENRSEYFGKLKELMEPDARAAVIEYKKSKGIDFHSVFKHYVPRDTLIQEMRDAGLRLAKEHDLLTHQSFMIFVVK